MKNKLITSNLDKTGEIRTHVIAGKKEKLGIYRIPLNLLVYNELNGRIATYISEYLDSNEIFPVNNEEKNTIMEEFIVESSKDTFKKTKENIHRFGQLEPAVVLDDGTVVDGNRRFSALRQLYREGKGQEFGFLLAAIIPIDKYNKKQIKVLELNLQHSKDKQVDYNPIDSLVDVYRDLIKGNEFTEQEYASETDSTLKKVQTDIAVAQLMVDYLDFIQQHEKFHIARKQKLDGPLREIHKILKSKIIDEEDLYDIQQVLFASLSSTDGDTTREIRKLRPVLENSKFREIIIDKTRDIVDDLDDHFRDEETKNNINSSSVVEIPKDIKKDMNSIISDIKEDYSLKQEQKLPIELLEKSLKNLKSVDIPSVKLMNSFDRAKFDKILYDIKNIINTLEQ